VARAECERPQSLVPQPELVVETLKLRPEMLETIFIDQAIAKVAQLGRINHVVNPA
jgi:hypothetical protein